MMVTQWPAHCLEHSQCQVLVWVDEGDAEAHYMAQGSQRAQDHTQYHKETNEIDDANLFLPHTKVMLDKDIHIQLLKR